MKIIFLDIDGVLNNNKTKIIWGIERECVTNLNHILLKTNANIVLISSWRNLIIEGHLKLSGFEYLLRSHGVNCMDRLVGLTPPDDVFFERWNQVEFFIKNTKLEIDSFVILDDCEDFPNYPDNYIQTDALTGLTKKDAEQAIEILGLK